MEEKYSEYDGVNTIEKEITCPYCKKAYSDYSEEVIENEEEDVILECPSCDKKFSVHKCITVDYRSHQNCALNKEEHKWEKSWWDKTSTTETCKICDMNRYPIIPKEQPK